MKKLAILMLSWLAMVPTYANGEHAAWDELNGDASFSPIFLIIIVGGILLLFLTVSGKK